MHRATGNSVHTPLTHHAPTSSGSRGWRLMSGAKGDDGSTWAGTERAGRRTQLAGVPQRMQHRRGRRGRRKRRGVEDGGAVGKLERSTWVASRKSGGDTHVEEVAGGRGGDGGGLVYVSTVRLMRARQRSTAAATAGSGAGAQRGGGEEETTRVRAHRWRWQRRRWRCRRWRCRRWRRR
jgi:hypothetical protein